jgi:hypothetical protein
MTRSLPIQAENPLNRHLAGQVPGLLGLRWCLQDVQLGRYLRRRRN